MRRLPFLVAFFLISAAAGCREAAADTSAKGPPASPRPPAGALPEEAAFFERYGKARPKSVLNGKAAYYANAFEGRKTANGERYDPRAFTCAHRSLPFGTILRVVRVDDGTVTYVRVTDRGPFGNRRRIVDLSRIAAERLHMVRDGVVNVRVEVLELGDSGRKR